MKTISRRNGKEKYRPRSRLRSLGVVGLTGRLIFRVAKYGLIIAEGNPDPNRSSCPRKLSRARGEEVGSTLAQSG